MQSLTTLFLISLLASAALLGQDMNPSIDYRRERLETQRREVIASLADKRMMQDSGGATIVRLQIEQGWKSCVEIEALALATHSERPARLLTETALTTCRPWQALLETALSEGSYPYIEAPDRPGRVSRDDMVAVTGLEARDAALLRILTWRGAALASAKPPSPAKPRADPNAHIAPRPIPERFAPPDPEPEKPVPTPTDPEEAGIVVVAQLRPGCRVQLADRTLSEQQLAAKAREWAANGTALKIVRPRGADYRCMTKIVFQLGKQGLRLFQFVEASDLDR